MTDEQPQSRRAARESAAKPATKPAKEGPSGFGALVSRHPKIWLASALAVIFLILGTGAVFAGVAVGSAEAQPVAESSPTPTQEPPRPVPTELTPAAALRTCSISALAKDPRLLKFAGSVINANTGEVLFDRSADVAAPPASVLKVLTAAAAIATIGPDFQMATRVYEGSIPGSIVLVGRGDPTLSALPVGSESVYPGAPKLANLAALTLAKWNETHAADDPITSIILDSTYWSPSDKWDSSWERSEQTQGYHSEVTALMVDGDRANPAASTSPRSTDPITRAGAAFRTALGLDSSVTMSSGSALDGATKLAEVKSQPIRTLLPQMLLPSDNTLAEMIARVISRETNGGGTSASLAGIIPAALGNFGLDTSGVIIRDGSGLSALNLVSPTFVAELMVKVLGGEDGLNLVRDAMPVAGESGSLASRFSGANSIARGSVIAKTGWIKTSRTLAGMVTAADGTPLTFAFYALGAVQPEATIALDTITTGVYSCGNNLSNN